MTITVNSDLKEKLKDVTSEEFKIYYLKHKNPRDRRRLVRSNLDGNHFVLQK